LKGGKIADMPVLTLTPVASGIDHRDLTNRVKTSWVIVTSSTEGQDLLLTYEFDLLQWR
jgi:hypothetical protein